MKLRSHILSPSVARGITIMCAVLFVASARPAHAGINVWTSRGPGIAFVTGLAIVPTTPPALYASTDGGVYYKSMDGGDTWNAANTAYPSSPPSACSPSTPPAEHALRRNVRRCVQEYGRRQQLAGVQ